MSCHLKTTGRIQSVSELRSFFFPNLLEDEDGPNDDEEDGWGDSDWGWEATENKENVTTDALNSWILDVHVGASSAGDHVAFGFDDKLAILQSKYCNQQQQQQQQTGLESDENCALFVTLFKDVIVSPAVSRDGAPPPPQERISCLTCLPIASQKRTSLSGAPDWTAILVGFTSGAIKFFTENGVFLLAQVFHEGESVERFKCLTTGNESAMQEELTIQYSNGIIVSIEGLGLVQTLRACRNQAARASAAGGTSGLLGSPGGGGGGGGGGSSAAAPPPVAYRKWSLKGLENVVDHVGVGVGTTCAFDQLQTASGFLGTRPFRLSPSSTYGYVATGAGPFVSFCYAREGATHSLITDVSSFVTNKLSSMLTGASSWFGLGGAGGKTEGAENKAPKIEPATALNITHALPDMRRHGESIALAPSTGGAVVDVGHGRHLAATTDSFGRVILIDVARKVAIRMWKGYRDAQLGFLQVQEDESSRRESPLNSASSPRLATFLVIYAPRRGILEVWTMEQGPRVGAFNVNKWCRLLYPGHEILGAYGKDSLSSSSSSSRSRRRLESLSSAQRSRLQFIDPDGAVKTIHVPFHLALTSKNSRRAEDLHLLKTFKSMMKDHRPPPEFYATSYPPPASPLDKEILRVLTSLKSHSIRHQALERLLQTPFVGHESMLRFAQVVVQLLVGSPAVASAAAAAASADDGAETAVAARAAGLDVDGRILLRYCRFKMQLLKVYAELFERNRNFDAAKSTKSANISPTNESSQSLSSDQSLAQSTNSSVETSAEASADPSIEILGGLSVAERASMSGLLRLAARTLTNESGSGGGDTDASTISSSSVRFLEDQRSPNNGSAEAIDISARSSSSSSSISSSKPRRLVSVCGFLASFEISRNNKTQTDEEGIDAFASSDILIPVRLSLDRCEPRFHKIALLFFAAELLSSPSSLSSSSPSSIEDLLRRCGIEAEYLLDLLLHAWLKTPAAIDVESPNLRAFAKLLTVITGMARLSESAAVNTVSDDSVFPGEGSESASAPSHTLVPSTSSSPSASSRPANARPLSPWWSRMRTACADAAWRSLPAALAASAIGRAAAESHLKESRKQKAEELGEKAEEEEDWIAVDEEKAAWTLLIRRLEDCLAIAVMFSFKNSTMTTLKTALKKSDESAAESSAEEDFILDGLSVNKILKAGRGGIPELVARWVARRGVTVDELLGEGADAKVRKSSSSRASFDDGHILSESSDGTLSPSVDASDLETISTASEALDKLVAKRIVHNLKWDVLAANCCWENAVLWNKFVEGHLPASPDGPHAYLRQSLCFLRTIKDVYLAQGLASLLWQTFLAKKIEALVNTMEKVKKAPKDRLCRQALGPELSAEAVASLLPLAKELLQFLLDINVESSSFNMKSRETDPCWNTSEGHAPLVELALHRRTPQPANVAHHILLLALVEAFFLFQIKSVKILSDLYDVGGRDAFFADLHAQHASLSASKASGAGSASNRKSVKSLEPKYSEARERLLRRILTVAVEHLAWLQPRSAETRSKNDGVASSSSSSLPAASSTTTAPTFDVPAMGDSILDISIPASLVRDWIGRVLGFSASGIDGGVAHHLGRYLGVDVDTLRRHLCCEFFSNGLDAQGEETLLIVSDKKEMGAMLLNIAGQRIAHHLLAGDDSKLASKQSDKLSLVSPQVAKWIKSLDWRLLRQPEVPLTSTAVLLGHVVDCLSEEDDDFRMAVSMVEAVQHLVD